MAKHSPKPDNKKVHSFLASLENDAHEAEPDESSTEQRLLAELQVINTKFKKGSNIKGGKMGNVISSNFTSDVGTLASEIRVLEAKISKGESGKEIGIAIALRVLREAVNTQLETWGVLQKTEQAIASAPSPNPPKTS